MKPSTLCMVIGIGLILGGGYLILTWTNFILIMVGMFAVPLGVHFLEVSTYVDQRLAEDYGLLEEEE